MRILLTTDTIGGVWTFTKDLCEGLLACGHEVALVSVGRQPYEGQAQGCKETRLWAGRRFWYEAWATPLEWMEANDAAYRGAEAALLRVAKHFRADVIHANQFCFGALPTDLPKVVTAHSDVLSWASACRPRGLGESAWLRRYCGLVADGLRGANAIVAPTQWMAGALARGFSAASNVRVVLNGRTIPCPPIPKMDRLLQAVSIGRGWDEAKGFAVLEGLDAAMPVVIAGETTLEGPGGAGALSEEQVLALFRRSSVYVAASVYEPFGLAPLEAALCGCAVVANDIGSLREVWGEAAIYFSGARQLKRSLDRLVETPSELRCAQLQARRRALEMTAERMVEGYLEIYRELLDGRERGLSAETAAYAG
jgi:glycosyltransferase involved in cell wall biosynthesis